jgi:cell fate regulator YaaT (PSP1 superfamily)
MGKQFVEIAFRQAGELFLFESDNVPVQPEDRVVVETEHGQALGTVKSIKDSDISPPGNFQLFRVVRVASAEDLIREQRHQHKEREAFDYCNQKIGEFELPMKLIRAEYFFSGSKLLFYFSAEGRVDFRALVRDLARYFQKRIEMRQIGVRDSAKLIGGVGPCGQQLCCNRFLRQFTPVSIRMAKDQSLPLNPQKVSGVCGRLMCCLAYEQDLYQAMRKRLPRIGEEVDTPDGRGRVREVFPLQELVRVVFLDREPPTEEEYKVEQLPAFSGKPYPDMIPVDIGPRQGGKQKRRNRRGLEPLMEPRHPGRGGGGGPSRRGRDEEFAQEEQEDSSHNPRESQGNRRCPGGKPAKRSRPPRERGRSAPRPEEPAMTPVTEEKVAVEEPRQVAPEAPAEQERPAEQPPRKQEQEGKNRQRRNRGRGGPRPQKKQRSGSGNQREAQPAASGDTEQPKKKNNRRRKRRKQKPSGPKE